MCKMSENAYAIMQLLGYAPLSPLWVEEVIEVLKLDALNSENGEARDHNILVKVKEGKHQVFIRVD